MNLHQKFKNGGSVPLLNLEKKDPYPVLGPYPVLDPYAVLDPYPVLDPHQNALYPQHC